MNNELLLESCNRLIRTNRCSSSVVHYYEKLAGIKLAESSIGGIRRTNLRLLFEMFKTFITLVILSFTFILAFYYMGVDDVTLSIMLSCMCFVTLVGTVLVMLFYYTRLGTFLTEKYPIKLNDTMSENYVDFVVEKGYVKVE